MKNQIKLALFSFNLFQGLDLIRRTPDCLQWLRNGATGYAPPPIKRLVITAYLRRYGLGAFVETGTHLGDTLALVAQDARRHCTSIELSEAYYHAAARRFAGYHNVRLLQGDSGALMPEVVAELQQPALFWLDGHYSGGTTAKGDLKTPISAELRAVLDSPIAGHVILIDDMRSFDGSHGYPHLDELLRNIRNDGRYAIEVSADIARITPR